MTSAENYQSVSLVPSKKIDSLEAARGIASFIVLFHHFFLAFLPSVKEAYPVGLGGTPLALLMRGESAVTFFFVLSGYVLVKGFYSRPDHTKILIAAGKRFPRLFLPVSVSILASLIIFKLRLNGNVEAASINGLDWLKTMGLAYFPNAPMFFPDADNTSVSSALAQSFLVFLVPNNFWYNANLWTMQPEFVGSLLVLAICGLTTLRYSRWMKHILIIVVAIATYKADQILLPFVAGCYLAFLTSSLQVKAMPRLVAFLGVIAAWMMLCSTGQRLEIIGSLLLMICLMYSPALSKGLSGRVGKWLGSISFPLYLVHLLVMSTISSHVFMYTYQIIGSSPISISLAGAATIIGSIAFAIPLAAFDRWWVARLNAFSRRVVGIRPQASVADARL